MGHVTVLSVNYRIIPLSAYSMWEIQESICISIRSYEFETGILWCNYSACYRQDSRLDVAMVSSGIRVNESLTNDCKVLEKLISKVATSCSSSLSIGVMPKLSCAPYIYNNCHWEFLMIDASLVNWNSAMTFYFLYSLSAFLLFASQCKAFV